MSYNQKTMEDMNPHLLDRR